MSAKTKATSKAWIAVYYADEHGDAPARSAMRDGDFPVNVRLALEARIKAVRDTPPPSFPTSSQIWNLMSKDRARGRVDMSGIYEVRDKHGDRLYRLFCLLDGQAESFGLEAPALVMLSVGIKPMRTVMPQSVYRRVRKEADRYLSSNPRAVFTLPGA